MKKQNIFSWHARMFSKSFRFISAEVGKELIESVCKGEAVLGRWLDELAVHHIQSGPIRVFTASLAW